MSYSYTIETEDQARERFRSGMEHFDRIGERGFSAYIPVDENRHGLFVFEITHHFPIVFSEEVGAALYQEDLIDSNMGQLEVHVRDWPLAVVSGILGRDVEVELYES